MAKQSGIHQIRGKVGEHSYYRQTGISSGLIRSINQGMSERVKTAEEYANTRLNNQEFGAACNVAGLLGKMVTPKYRPMILPFSQSKMAKEILKLARQNTDQWGQRTVSSSQTEQLAAILSAQSKRNASEFVTCGVSRSSLSAATLSCSYTGSQADTLLSLGITELYVNGYQYNLATGQWNQIALEMATGYSQLVDDAGIFAGEPIIAGQEASMSEDIVTGQFIPEANHAGHQLVVFVIMPARSIAGTTHILQEYCSFVAMPLPAAA